MSDFLVFRSALRDLLRPGRLIVTGLLVALPAAISLLWRFSAWRAAEFDPAVVYNQFETTLVFGFTLVIMTVVYATGVVSQDVEGRTIVYLLTRPLPRWRILLAKFLASFVVVVLTVSLSSVALALAAFGPARLDESRLVRDLQILPLGALAYGSVFLFLATVTRWALLIGLLFAFGWEAWVPMLPGEFPKLALMGYLRVLAPHPLPLSGDPDLQGFFQRLNPPSISMTVAWIVVACVIAAGLAGALVAFSEREYAPRDDAT